MQHLRGLIVEISMRKERRSAIGEQTFVCTRLQLPHAFKPVALQRLEKQPFLVRFKGYSPRSRSAPTPAAARRLFEAQMQAMNRQSTPARLPRSVLARRRVRPRVHASSRRHRPKRNTAFSQATPARTASRTTATQPRGELMRGALDHARVSRQAFVRQRATLCPRAREI